ncbi:hypothetical protein NEIELOOT_00041 [Neisseria elongata subsp. glycolytica ATCC 29315]|uniref:Uncharacterized protein n=1 Tax=Neisseria elongata subsp. glycolytica ATCC 29315 TaxID=546263 RepID=D4DLY1_NEIEG|nr:hypothetical protein NEIELOOT_00041 [Neisseria elongata subsp. glycolytica ATCC 29315]
MCGAAKALSSYAKTVRQFRSNLITVFRRGLSQTEGNALQSTFLI